MDQSQLNWITDFIWNIADDVLRDVYVRGKYRDVILPMTVLRKLDAVLEPTKQDVMEMKAALDHEKVTNQDAALRTAAGQAFYNNFSFSSSPSKIARIWMPNLARDDFSGGRKRNLLMTSCR